jgi:tRNA A-37 threonylcarbamoyl transferase component Bud32
MRTSDTKPVEISREVYDKLIHNSVVLEKDKRADKVLQLADGTFLKLFRQKPWLSSATLQPYAIRFIDNARLLKAREIPTVRPTALFNIPAIAHMAVQYDPLPGKTLRQIAENDGFTDSQALQLGEFIALLHNKGVYFRSLHLGNIILTPEGKPGLIDIADMFVRKKPLRIDQRIRNFRHMLRYARDKRAIGQDSLKKVTAAYMENADLSQPGVAIIEKAFRSMLRDKSGDQL